MNCYFPEDLNTCLPRGWLFARPGCAPKQSFELRCWRASVVCQSGHWTPICRALPRTATIWCSSCNGSGRRREIHCSPFATPSARGGAKAVGCGLFGDAGASLGGACRRGPKCPWKNFPGRRGVKTRGEKWVPFLGPKNGHRFRSLDIVCMRGGKRGVKKWTPKWVTKKNQI
jgi:hypothetical protein